MDIKKRLVSVRIMCAPDWSLPFKIMCDASDFVVGAFSRQQHEKIFWAIYYASHTLNEDQENYTTTKKEMLAIVFSYNKFRPYIIGSKVIIHTNHAALRYLIQKKDAKP